VSADPARNSHRGGERWIVRTVLMILENPRYTGRQVWNRHSTKGHGPGGRTTGHGSGQLQRNPATEWEVSEQLAHDPLVDDATFLAVQRIRAGRPTKDGQIRQYLLAGLVACGLCGRRMDAHWVHGRPSYRCRHGYSSATRRPADAPRNVYHREDHLLDALRALLTDLDQEGTAGADVSDLADVLRGRGLQIVCTYQDRWLRAENLQENVDTPGQTDLQLVWSASAPHYDHYEDQLPFGVAHPSNRACIAVG
jgi:hypothetical protein